MLTFFLVTVLITQLWKRNQTKHRWKCNCSLLKNKQFIDEINKIAEEYAATHYYKTSIPGITKADLELTDSDKVFLDSMLMEIRSRTITYATMKRKNTRETRKYVKRDKVNRTEIK